MALALIAVPCLRALRLARCALLFISTAAAGCTGGEYLIGRPVIGISGGIAGLSAALLVTRPRARIAGFPVVAIVPAWLGVQILFSTLGPAWSGVAWSAHLIGAAIGAVLSSLSRIRMHGVRSLFPIRPR